MLSKSLIVASVESLQSILNAVPNPIFLKDRRHRLVLVNDALCEVMGKTRDELLSQSDDHLPAEQRDVFWKVDDDVFATGISNENEEVLTDGTGALRVIVTRKRLLRLPTDDGEQPFILGVISDVTRFRESEARAQYLAEHDTLTGLANRSQLNERLAAAIEAAGRNKGQLAVLLLDLDGFKTVNDRYGHPAGDELLSILAKRLAGLVRVGDTVARLGGDEFCIVQAPLPQPADAYNLAKRILSSVARPLMLGVGKLSVSTSIGVALFPEDGTTAQQLLQRADQALYAVKRGGRRHYRRYQSDASLPSGEWDIETDLRMALQNHQLSLAFQPLTAAADGKARGFEALVRWVHPTRGQIPPDVFIPVAEATGMIQQLGTWVLHQATAAAVRWPWTLQVSVNVSPVQLEAGNLPEVIESALAASGLPGSRLELEVTETALLNPSERILDQFVKLKALGVGLALDDFGSGWSSLTTLRNFHFDRIKIDRSFIANIATDARSVAIVRAVLSLGHALDVPITAEGVEVQAQLVALRQMGCAELQGFYLGAPHQEATLPETHPWDAFLVPLTDVKSDT